MTNLLLIITLTLASAYYLKKIAGYDLLASSICRLLEHIGKYRRIITEYGFYNLPELDDFAKNLHTYFSAITAVKMYFDEYGWQFAEFEIVKAASGNVPGVRQAISIAARNYLKTSHGIDNPNICVLVLTDNVLCLQIACSKKSHELAQTRDFSEPAKRHHSIDETIK